MSKRRIGYYLIGLTLLLAVACAPSTAELQQLVKEEIGRNGAAAGRHRPGRSWSVRSKTARMSPHRAAAIKAIKEFVAMAERDLKKLIGWWTTSSEDIDQPAPERVRILVEIERVPDLEWDQWVSWCEAHGFDALASYRRAWISRLATYLRNDDCLIYFDGSLLDTAHSSELEFTDEPT